MSNLVNGISSLIGAIIGASMTLFIYYQQVDDNRTLFLLEKLLERTEKVGISDSESLEIYRLIKENKNNDIALDSLCNRIIEILEYNESNKTIIKGLITDEEKNPLSGAKIQHLEDIYYSDKYGVFTAKLDGQNIKGKEITIRLHAKKGSLENQFTSKIPVGKTNYIDIILK